jgi:membrane-associated phospholipid phosphatase
MNWESFVRNKSLRLEFVFTIIFFIAVLLFFSRFLQFVEKREGIILSDPILNSFNPVDLTWLTFVLIYISVIIAIIMLLQTPQRLMFAIQCYTLLVIFRTITMFLTPLQAPITLIPLNDPFVQLFGNGEVLRNDLFFSGHTATLFLLYLISEKKILKRIFLIFTLLVGTAVILQHVHYAVDVAAAPFFSYASFKTISSIKSKFGTDSF